MARQIRKPTAAERNRKTQERIRKKEIEDIPASTGGGGLNSAVKVSYRGGTMQTIYAISDTALVFTDIIFDSTGGAMWISADPTRFTAPDAGLYSFKAGWSYVGDVGTSVADAYLMRNATTILHYVSGGKRNAVSSDYYQELSADIYLDAGDDIQIFLHQETGVDQLIRATNSTPSERYRLPHASMALIAQ